MKKFLLFVFAAVFVSNSSNAYDHGNHRRDDVRRDNGFYDEYHQGYGEDYDDRDDRHRFHHDTKRHRMEERMHHGGDRKFRLKKGTPSKKRKYNKRQLHQQKMHRMKRRLNKLPPAKRDAALKEIDRHHREMQNIIGNDKRFPEFSGHGMRRSPSIAKVKAKPMPKNKPVPNRIKKDPIVTPKTSTNNVKSAPIPTSPTNNSEQKNESRNINVKWRYPKKMV